ncbi:hypothetical protein [Streptomyces sp. NPDC005303]|uniref:hypothetical protein n=1 Tax=Streptomyces sp. NPDC005303 TaxID=3155713 RepID=UPI0033A02399
MRESVDSFEDVARLTISGGNYTELSPEELHLFARWLDEAEPQICHTRNGDNQLLMNDLADQVLMRPDYWTSEVERQFDQHLAKDLVRFVISQMKDQKRNNFRPTEFWRFAANLHDVDPELAQTVRVESIIHSHGTLAVNLNLPMVVPAPYSQPVGRIYGTGSPVHATSEIVELKSGIFTEGMVTEAKRAIYLLAKELTASEVREIRETAEYTNYIAALAKSDRGFRADANELKGRYRNDLQRADLAQVEAARASAELLESEFFKYLITLNNLAPLAMEGKLPRRRILIRASNATKVAGKIAPTPVGWVAGPAAGLARGATGLFFYMLNRYGPARMIEQEETRARLAQTRLIRNEHVKVEFFGPVDAKYWWLYEGE